MGRSAEFHGAYGDFGPEPVDINLSDKVDDHPHYGQDPDNPFHDPNLPSSPNCQFPGCGRQVHEHRAQSMKPTRAAYEMLTDAAAAHKQTVREGKERAAQQSYQNDLQMQGHYGIGEHTITGKGWSDRGPQTKAELKNHLVEDHDVWEEDADEMDDHAAAHARWHASGGENHEHGPPRKRR